VHNATDEIGQAIRGAYSIKHDDRAFKGIALLFEQERPRYFDALRKSYRRRLEFGHYRVYGANKQRTALTGLGFRLPR